MEHLTSELMEALSRGDGAAVAHFRKHLEQPCPTCEAYLLGADAQLQLDGVADALLLHRPGAQDDRGYQAVRRKLRGRRRTVLGAFAGALAMAAAALLFIQPASIDDGIKGPARTMVLELLLAHQREDGAVVRVDPSASLPASGILVLRYHASEAATARILRQKPADAAPVLLGVVALQAGMHELPVGISLEGEAGPTTFILEALSERGETARAELKMIIEGR